MKTFFAWSLISTAAFYNPYAKLANYQVVNGVFVIHVVIMQSLYNYMYACSMVSNLNEREMYKDWSFSKQVCQCFNLMYIYQTQKKNPVELHQIILFIFPFQKSILLESTDKFAVYEMQKEMVEFISVETLAVK